MARRLTDRVATAAVPPAAPPLPARPPLAPDAEAQERFDRSLHELLARVNARLPSPKGAPAAPGSGEEHWWSPQPALGFRTWDLVGDRLRGARTPWRSSTMEAECLHLRDQPPGAAPHRTGECGRSPCGIYAMKHTDELRSRVAGAMGTARRRSIGIGLVSMSGRVIEHDRGYRAQHTRVIAFALITPTSDGMADVLATADPASLDTLFAAPRQSQATMPTVLVPRRDAVDHAFAFLAGHVTTAH